MWNQTILFNRAASRNSSWQVFFLFCLVLLVARRGLQKVIPFSATIPLEWSRSLLWAAGEYLENFYRAYNSSKQSDAHDDLSEWGGKEAARRIGNRAARSSWEPGARKGLAGPVQQELRGAERGPVVKALGPGECLIVGWRTENLFCSSKPRTYPVR